MSFLEKMIENTNFPYLEYAPTVEDILNASRCALLKSQHTMNANQNGQDRNSVLKYDRQLQGALGEIMTQKFLLNLFDDIPEVSIVRYDDVRTDGFRSPRGEYDLKIITPKREFIIETRSSKHHADVDNNIFRNQKIIGPYSNKVKRGETMSDFFFKPVFCFSDNNQTNRQSNSRLLDALNSGTVRAILLGAASRKALVQNGFEGTLGQSTTTYQLLEIDENSNMINFGNNLNNFIKKSCIPKKTKKMTP